MRAARPPDRPAWWAPPQGVTRRDLRVLGVLGTAFAVNYYDFGILGLALRQIQEGLAVPEDQIGAVSAVVRLGVLPALGMTVLGDVFGRRRLLLVTIVGFTILCGATAFSRTIGEFMALQFCARAFMYAEEMLAIVVIAETLQASTRGWGIGALSALATLGYGAAALMFALVDRLPYGWRALYAASVIPLVLLTWLRRSLEESGRFTEHRRRQGTPRGLRATLAPARALLRMYPGRLATLAGALLPTYVIIGTALTFQSKYLQETHGYTPGAVATLYMVGGLVAILGNLAAGALSDRLGRRRVMLGGFVVLAASAAGFYNATGAWVPALWVAMNFTICAVEVLFSALGSELFPTSYRSTASGARAAMATLGAAFGLWAEGRVFLWTGSHGTAITCLVAAVSCIPPIMIRVLPETATRELEDIAPERPLS